MNKKKCILIGVSVAVVAVIAGMIAEAIQNRRMAKICELDNDGQDGPDEEEDIFFFMDEDL